MKKYLLILVTLAFFSTGIFGQTSIPKAQSMFIYNFSRLIEWPASFSTGDFVIGVLGHSDIGNELKSYTMGKKVGVQSIKVEEYKDPSEIGKCNILFVSFGKTKEMPAVLSKIGGNSTLIITEKRGACDDGAAINFLIVSNALKFEIKPSNAKNGIKLSSKLSDMATQVY